MWIKRVGDLRTQFPLVDPEEGIKKTHMIHEPVCPKREFLFFDSKFRSNWINIQTRILYIYVIIYVNLFQELPVFGQSTKSNFLSVSKKMSSPSHSIPILWCYVCLFYFLTYSIKTCVHRTMNHRWFCLLFKVSDRYFPSEQSLGRSSGECWE